MSYSTPAPIGPIIASIAVTGLPTLCIEAIYLLPKYLDHRNSLTGIVAPNPNPYRKNPMRRKICSCVLLDKIINKTPVAEVDNAMPASLRASNLCNPHPHNTLELRFPIPLTLKAIAPSDLVYPISVAKGIA